jgi:hypothetical protein
VCAKWTQIHSIHRIDAFKITNLAGALVANFPSTLARESQRKNATRQSNCPICINRVGLLPKLVIGAGAWRRSGSAASLIVVQREKSTADGGRRKWCAGREPHADRSHNMYWMCFTFTGGPADVNTRDRRRRRALVTHVSPCESTHVPDFTEQSDLIDSDVADEFGARAMKCARRRRRCDYNGGPRDYPRGMCIL